MQELELRIAVAQRRLLAQRFVRLLPAWLTVGATIATAAVLADKVWALGVIWWAWLTVAVVLGACAAAAHAWWTAPTHLAAALEIDRRFGLKERVSSALALDEATRETAAGRAVVDDACRKLARIEIQERFTIRVGRTMWIPIAPAALAVLLALFLGPISFGDRAAADVDPQVAEDTREAATALRRKLVQRREEALEQGLAEAAELFQRLEESAEELRNKPPADRKESLVKLNDLARQLRERRERLGGAEKIKEQLKQLGGFEKGPADRFAQAVKEGNFQKAIRELDALREKLANEELTDAEKEQLGKQLDQMRERLEQMAAAQQEARKQLEEQLAQAQREGRADEAAELERQLEQLNQQMAQQEQMNKLAERLGQCSQCLKQGNGSQAAEQLEMAASDLQTLSRQFDELTMLDDTLDQIGQCKNGLCQGDGNRRGQGDGGRGRGQGEGFRPEQEEDTNAYDTRVNQQVTPGSATVTDLVDGPNVAGQIQQEITEQLDEVERGTASPLTTQRLPRPYREQTKGYFDALRED